MKNQDTTAKLAHVEARMRRWHTRLARASNMLLKLEKQRRRLLLQQEVGVGRPKQPKPGDLDYVNLSIPAANEFKAKRQEAISTSDPDLVEKVAAALDIPPFLKRDEAVDVAKLAAQRKSKEAAARKQMPLTGRAAEEYIKPKRKK